MFDLKDIVGMAKDALDGNKDNALGSLFDDDDGLIDGFVGNDNPDSPLSSILGGLFAKKTGQSESDSSDLIGSLMGGALSSLTGSTKTASADKGNDFINQITKILTGTLTSVVATNVIKSFTDGIFKKIGGSIAANNQVTPQIDVVDDLKQALDANDVPSADKTNILDQIKTVATTLIK